MEEPIKYYIYYKDRGKNVLYTHFNNSNFAEYALEQLGKFQAFISTQKL